MPLKLLFARSHLENYSIMPPDQNRKPVLEAVSLDTLRNVGIAVTFFFQRGEVMYCAVY